jgi:hypothetical protein
MLLSQQQACGFSCHLEGEVLLVGEVEQPLCAILHDRQLSLHVDVWNVLPQAGVVTQQLLLVVREKQHRHQKQLASCLLSAITIIKDETGLLTGRFPPAPGKRTVQGGKQTCYYNS